MGDSPGDSNAPPWAVPAAPGLMYYLTVNAEVFQCDVIDLFGLEPMFNRLRLSNFRHSDQFVCDDRMAIKTIHPEINQLLFLQWSRGVKDLEYVFQRNEKERDFARRKRPGFFQWVKKEPNGATDHADKIALRQCLPNGCIFPRRSGIVQQSDQFSDSSLFCFVIVGDKLCPLARTRQCIVGRPFRLPKTAKKLQCRAFGQAECHDLTISKNTRGSTIAVLERNVG